MDYKNGDILWEDVLQWTIETGIDYGRISCNGLIETGIDYGKIL